MAQHWHGPKFLQVLSELGIIFLLFAIGLETPFSELRKVGRIAMLVAVCGVIVPLISGFALILALGGGEIEALFIATAMVATSVGSLPVSSRIWA